MISKTGIHALRALASMAQMPNGRYVGAADLAKATGAPSNYLGKLLKVLGREGLVESQKGRGGGFRLAKDPARITLLDVMEPAARVGRWTGCFMGRTTCSNDAPCALHHRWSAARDAYFQFLKETTVADLATQFVPNSRPVDE